LTTYPKPATAKMFTKLLKKNLIRYFTRNPYQIKSFTDLYASAIGEAIDVPELLTRVLHHETGLAMAYNLPFITYNQSAPTPTTGGQPRFKSYGIFKEPDRYLYSISNGVVWSAIGLIYDYERRSFVNESAKEWTINLNDSIFTNVVHFPPKTYLEGITLSCLTNGADGGFYHFLLESIVKLHFAKPVIEHVDHILLNGPVTNWKLKWLERANIDIAKIIWADNTAHYQCGQLLFTNRLVEDQQISPWCVNSLKILFNVATVPQTIDGKVLWITRKGTGSRDIVWEYQLLQNFPLIEVIDLSLLNASETIEKMQLATHIIAPHGAGLSNIYLCNEGAQVLELYPHDMQFKPCFYRLSAVCNFKHHVASINFKDANDSKIGVAFLTNLLSEFICQS
jgi:hypothetical protein